MKLFDLVRTAAVAALAVSLGASPAMAKTGGSTKAKPTVVKAKPAKAPAVSATAGAKTKSQAPKAKSTAVKAKANGSAAQQTSAKAKKGTEAKPAISSADPAPTSPTEPRPTVPLSKAQEKLAKNANLRAKMQARLPGWDVMGAASGFKNLGQFVAAVNVSNNQGISFKLLKTLMVSEGLSLGQAIQRAKSMDPARATTVANTAVVQANADIAASTTTSTKKAKTKG